MGVELNMHDVTHLTVDFFKASLIQTMLDFLSRGDWRNGEKFHIDNW